MKEEAKKMEKKNPLNYIEELKNECNDTDQIATRLTHGHMHSFASTKYLIFELLEKIDQFEKERDELKLKEEIAHTAKDIAQDAHQKSQKELQALKDVMREYKKAKEAMMKSGKTGEFFKWKDKRDSAWNKIKSLIK